MKAFVTGGSGFVGRNLIGALRERGASVRALARSEAAAQAVRAAGAEAVIGDLDDESRLQTAISGCDTVFHAAAMLGDWGRYEDFHRVNVAGSARLLAAARRAGARRLVHVSTEAVLVGGPTLVNADESWPRPPRPVGLYPLTKAMAEELVLSANGPDLTTVVARPRFIWGKGDTSLLPRIIEAVRAGKFAWIAGGRYLTSTCHVANVCEGLLLAAERGRGGEIYFLTDGAPIEFRAFITSLVATAGLDPGNRSIPRWLARLLATGTEALWRTLSLPSAPPINRMVVRLMGEEVTVNDAKARRELGYTASVSRQAGLAEMINQR